VNISILNRLYEMAFGLIAHLRREEGQTMAEYGLLLAVIAVVVVAAAVVLGKSISSLFLGVASSL
jgi:pilus assembly protein Flp/PilA